MKNKISLHFKKSKTPGAAFAIIDRGKVDFFFNGVMGTSAATISENSLFELGSVTKIFTATILMDFVKRQMIALDDPIAKFLPFLQFSKLKTKEIKLKHLATHYSGLPNIPSNLVPSDVKNPYVNYTIQDLYNFLKNYKPRRAPGEQFEYSNLGFGLLGHILSLVSEKSYEQLVTETIFNKLSMTHSSFLNIPNVEEHLCIGHFMQQSIPPWETSPAFVGAVGIRSTIKDMAQFLIANMKTSPLSDLFTKSHQFRYPCGHNESIGLGWLIQHSKNGNIIWHDGITAGFQSFIGFNTQINKGIVALSNSSIHWISSLSFEILSSSIIDKGLK